MKSKKILSTIILIITIMGFSTISNAALESKAGQNSCSATVSDHFIGIRAMEKSGGTLGLDANIDNTTYLDSSKNGIDVHMALATEWGTAALLAISDYGSFNTNGVIDDSNTKIAATTGNITGVFQMANGGNSKGHLEYVAGVFEGGLRNFTGKLYDADGRYRNEYTATSSEYHKGDAMYQTAGWYGGGKSYATQASPAYFRTNGLLGFGNNAGVGSGFYGYTMCSRACIVCGEGL